MLDDLNQDQLKLAGLMSKISEDAFSAGWIEGLEYRLWEISNGGKNSYGGYIVPQEELQQLKFLSDKCGCWIFFDDENEETAIDLESWKNKYNEKMGNNPVGVLPAFRMNSSGTITIKKLLIICALSIAIFIAMTISTAKLESAFDGNDTYGFPLTFFIRFSGMCEPCLPGAPESEIFYWRLLVDLLTAAIIPVLSWAIFNKVKNNLKK
jgi:hypothetical protein